MLAEQRSDIDAGQYLLLGSLRQNGYTWSYSHQLAQRHGNLRAHSSQLDLGPGFTAAARVSRDSESRGARVQCHAQQCAVLGLRAAAQSPCCCSKPAKKSKQSVFGYRAATLAEQAGVQAFRGTAQRRAVVRPSGPQRAVKELPEFANRGQKRSCRYLDSVALHFHGTFLAISWRAAGATPWIGFLQARACAGWALRAAALRVCASSWLDWRVSGCDLICSTQARRLTAPQPARHPALPRRRSAGSSWAACTARRPDRPSAAW